MIKKIDIDEKNQSIKMYIKLSYHYNNKLIISKISSCKKKNIRAKINDKKKLISTKRIKVSRCILNYHTNELIISKQNILLQKKIFARISNEKKFNDT
jgi:hypothetical protein